MSEVSRGYMRRPARARPTGVEQMSTSRATALPAVLVLLTVLAGCLLPAGPVAALEQPRSPVVSPGHVLFNDPLGPEDRQYALIRHIDARIGHARPGATVRLAAYSFAMPSTSRAAPGPAGASTLSPVSSASSAAARLVDMCSTPVGRPLTGAFM